jgi:hypothetical protein
MRRETFIVILLADLLSNPRGDPDHARLQATMFKSTEAFPIASAAHRR